MTKTEFLGAICHNLSGLSEADIERSLDYYRELLDDATEDGKSESEAVASLGNPDEIAGQILSELPFFSLTGFGIHRGGAGAAGVCAKTIALCLGLWALLLLVCIVSLTFAVGAVSGIVGAVWFACSNYFVQALFVGGLAFVCIGLVLLLVSAMRSMQSGFIRYGQQAVHRAKQAIIRKGLAG